jgi:hypothetical protein
VGIPVPALHTKPGVSANIVVLLTWTFVFLHFGVSLRRVLNLLVIIVIVVIHSTHAARGGFFCTLSPLLCYFSPASVILSSRSIVPLISS